MSNSNTEHSKQLRLKTAKKWQKDNKQRATMNNCASKARKLAREGTIEELPLLEEILNLIRSKKSEIKSNK